MEIADLIYIELLKTFDGDGVNVKYIYDLRVADIGELPAVVVYYVSERDRWFNIGSGKFYKEQNVAVEILARDKQKYSEIKDKVFSVFDGKSVFHDPAETATDISTLVTAAEEISFYIDKVTVSDVTGISEGERVYYGSGSGWVRWISGYDLYVLKAEGEFVLVRPNSISDKSDKLKKLWRCLIGVGGKVIPVG